MGTEPLEIVTINADTTFCDGGDPALGHPRVFLNLGHDGEVVCPYCGRRFVNKALQAVHSQSSPTEAVARRSSAA